METYQLPEVTAYQFPDTLLLLGKGNPGELDLDGLPVSDYYQVHSLMAAAAIQYYLTDGNVHICSVAKNLSMHTQDTKAYDDVIKEELQAFGVDIANANITTLNESHETVYELYLLLNLLHQSGRKQNIHILGIHNVERARNLLRYHPSLVRKVRKLKDEGYDMDHITFMSVQDVRSAFFGRPDLFKNIPWQMFTLIQKALLDPRARLSNREIYMERIKNAMEFLPGVRPHITNLKRGMMAHGPWKRQVGEKYTAAQQMKS